MHHAKWVVVLYTLLKSLFKEYIKKIQISKTHPFYKSFVHALKDVCVNSYRITILHGCNYIRFQQTHPCSLADYAWPCDWGRSLYYRSHPSVLYNGLWSPVLYLLKHCDVWTISTPLSPWQPLDEIQSSAIDTTGIMFPTYYKIYVFPMR